MSVMFEVYYRSPADERRERDLTRTVEAHGGQLDCREDAPRPDGPIVLTYVFQDRTHAEDAARVLRETGEHVEGPGEYPA
jgi:hypothetical protein